MKNLKSILNKNNFTGYIEADGGVNLENIGSCFADGARAFVGGSAIIGQPDVRETIRDFRNQVLKERRKMIIEQAHEIGGADLVNKWIGLHIVGEKKDQITKIAKEEGLL